MKKIFRFFRAELNGKILNSICSFLNTHVFNTGLLDELLYHATCRWDVSEDTQTKYTSAMREEDIFNIGLISGLPYKRVIAESTLGSIRLVPSSVTHESHKYLFDMIYERFRKPDNLQSNEDINILADENFRSSLVEGNANYAGYVLEGDENNLFDENGNIIQERILQEKPTTGAYNKFFNVKYLTLENLFEKHFTLAVDIYKRLFESVQQIRHSGVSLSRLMETTKILSGGYVHQIELLKRSNEFWWTLEYSLNDTLTSEDDIQYREQRHQIWLIFMKLKFPMVTLQDRSLYEQ